VTRAEFVAACKALEGVPYRWGGKDPRGLDCSGLVTWPLRALGGADLRATHNSARMWLELDEVVEPRPGDLAFYGPRDAPSHVVVCLGGPHDQILGANGGGRNVLTVEQAHAARAFVKRKPTPRYRPDFLGYRRNRWTRD
jgi:murein DD-endopeptidase